MMPRLGRLGEEAACRFLERKRYRILERNYRCRLGEIDVVAEDAGVIVFCEVKTRTGERFGAPFEAVHRQKQERLRRLALAYLQANPEYRTRDLRFDVLSVMWSGDRPSVDHLKNAAYFYD